MKRILTLILVLCIMENITMPVHAEEDGLLFDMDLTDYTEDNPVVKNAVTDSAEGITVYGKGESQAPGVGSMSTLNGETKYITTGEMDDNAVPMGVVQLDDVLAREMSQSNALTIEFWTKSDMPKTSYLYYKLFKLSLRPYDSSMFDDSIDWEMSVQSTSGLENRYARVSDSATDYKKFSVSNFPRNAWTHYVVTREWNEDASCWDSVVYINGAKKASGSGGIKSTSPSAYGFTIGGSGIAEKSYMGSFASFRVYKRTFDVNEAKNRYLSTKDSYASLPKTMNLISPSDGTEIVPSAGVLEVEFDNFIDKSTLGEIAFTKGDAGDIPGGIYLSTEEGNTKKVQLCFGGLEPGSEYILHIGDVYSINHIKTESKDIRILTSDIYMVNEDFSELDTGAVTDISDSRLTYFSSGVNNDPKDFTVKEVSSKVTGQIKKYMEMKTSDYENEKDSYLAYTFAQDFDKDFVIELGVRGQGSPRDRSVRVLQGSYLSIANFINGTSISNGGNAVKLIKSYNTSETDEYGFLNMRYIFRKNENGKYTVTGTCPNDPSVEYEALTDFTAITSIRAMNQYNIGSDAITTELSYFRIYEYVPPTVIITNAEELTRESENIEAVFSDDMEGFTNDSIKIRRPDGSFMNTEFLNYDEYIRKATVSIKEYFDYGKSYSLIISGVSSKTGIPINDTQIDFRFRDYELFSTVSGMSGGGIRVNISNNSFSQKTALVVAVGFDENGRIKKTESKEVTVLAGQMQPVELPAIENVKKAAVYVLDLTEGENRATTPEPYCFEY